MLTVLGVVAELERELIRARTGKARNGGSFAMNLHEVRPGFARWYVEQIADNCKAMGGRERRKYGIERRGLCLLISYTAEILQTDKAPIALTDHSRR